MLLDILPDFFISSKLERCRAAVGGFRLTRHGASRSPLSSPSPGFLRDAHHANTAAQMPQHHGTPGSSPLVTPRSLSLLSPNIGTPPAVNLFSPPASVRSFSVSPEQNAVITPFASTSSTHASSPVDVPRASYNTTSRPSSANSPALRQSALGASGCPRRQIVPAEERGLRVAAISPSILRRYTLHSPRLPRPPLRPRLASPRPSPPFSPRAAPFSLSLFHQPSSRLSSPSASSPPSVSSLLRARSMHTYFCVLDASCRVLLTPHLLISLLLDSLLLDSLNEYFRLLMPPGALRIVFGLHDVLLQNPASLCSVLGEDFIGTTTESVFGDNGWLAREVDMSGFGILLLFSFLHVLPFVRPRLFAGAMCAGTGMIRLRARAMCAGGDGGAAPRVVPPAYVLLSQRGAVLKGGGGLLPAFLVGGMGCIVFLAGRDATLTVRTG
ncbi:hypothetical protein C8J57DRAFT_1725200 [Mycena rebaudengoi]|nr:hypothetical protein C8J57DRAFT_1725200 [Mycena rebaudengoi]